MSLACAWVDGGRGSIPKAIELTRSAEKAPCDWTVRAGEANAWVRPCGFAIVSNCQFGILPGQAHHLE